MTVAGRDPHDESEVILNCNELFLFFNPEQHLRGWLIANSLYTKAKDFVCYGWAESLTGRVSVPYWAWTVVTGIDIEPQHAQLQKQFGRVAEQLDHRLEHDAGKAQTKGGGGGWMNLCILMVVAIANTPRPQWWKIEEKLVEMSNRQDMQRVLAARAAKKASYNAS